nr:hypothetical protein [Nitrosomonas sp. Nm33]
MGIGEPSVIDGFCGKTCNIGADHGVVDGCDAIVRQTGKALHLARDTLGYRDNMVSPRVNNAQRPS